MYCYIYNFPMTFGLTSRFHRIVNFIIKAIDLKRFLTVNEFHKVHPWKGEGNVTRGQPRSLRAETIERTSVRSSRSVRVIRISSAPAITQRMLASTNGQLAISA